MKLDFSLSTKEQRISYVEKLLKDFEPTQKEMSLICDYVLFSRDKNQTVKERKEEYPITTANRELTINKRQISYEGLIDKLENGEDGLYALINDNKEMKLDHKDLLTQEDIENIPGIKESVKTIFSLQEQYEKATGQKRKMLKATIIDTWKQIYLIKGSHQIGLSFDSNKNVKSLAYISIPEEIYFDDKDMPHSDSPLSLLNPEHVSFLLRFYQQLKQETWDLLEADMTWHLIDLENIASAALEKKYPILWDVLIWKIDKLTNKQIQQEVLNKYGENHSEQYYSSLWRKRIPRLISEEAKKRCLLKYWFDHPHLKWKTCSKCGRSYPAHLFFFSKNTTKDGFYSQCKKCHKK